ncbi:MAG: prepilin-type N-terminal cleavage/methylation domain-containing protein [Bryobacteraceae bacterium]|jgi:prepilin-type N-terminal cleavage/methylation domain-containing protein
MTLLEMMVVVAIISLIAAISYPGISRGMERIRLRVAADDVAAFLSQAMSRTERTESPIEVRFVKKLATIQMAGPNTPLRTLRLPEGVTLSEVYPVPEEGPQPEPSVLLMPGGAFPSVTVELSTSNAGKRTVRIDPVTGVPVIDSTQLQSAVVK